MVTDMSNKKDGASGDLARTILKALPTKKLSGAHTANIILDILFSGFLLALVRMIVMASGIADAPWWGKLGMIALLVLALIYSIHQCRKRCFLVDELKST